MATAALQSLVWQRPCCTSATHRSLPDPSLLCLAVSLVPDDGKSYAVATIAGRQLRETSAVGSFPRPAQPIVLYEFEGEELLVKHIEALVCGTQQAVAGVACRQALVPGLTSCGPPLCAPHAQSKAWSHQPPFRCLVCLPLQCRLPLLPQGARGGGHPGSGCQVPALPQGEGYLNAAVECGI